MTQETKRAIKQLELLGKISPKKLRLAAEWKEDWQVLISTILSAQTRDETTIRVCEKLFKKFDSPKKLGDAPIRDIANIIRPVNYHRTKSKNIKASAKIISAKGIPEKIEDLIKLPGVGRKTANVYIAEFHKGAAIGVDTHVSFISQKLGWTKHKNPHKIEEDLRKLFPKRYWRRINYNLVRFGRTYNRRKQVEIINKLKMNHSTASLNILSS